jgi:hypothetical protein
MNFKMTFLFFITYIVFNTSSLIAAPQCQSLFQNNPLTELSTKQTVQLNLKLFMERFKPQQVTTEMVKNLADSVATLLSDTTGKRIENKVTADATVVQDALLNFRNKLKSKGLELIDRDKKTPGLRNVTYTEYTRPFFISNQVLQKMGFEVRPEAITQPNQKTTVKIRVRSYGTVDESLSSFNIQDIKFAEFTKDRAFVEFKFKDPSYEGAVFKPQMYMKKEYIKLFGSEEFIRRFTEIKVDTLANLKISSKKTLDQKSVEAMLQFIYNAHVSKLDLSTAAINLYERSAQSVALKYHSEKDPDFDKKYGSIEDIELQMTFDQLISLYIPEQGYMIGTGQYYKAYAPEQVVSEFKTPTLIAHHLQRALNEAKKENKIGLVVNEAHAKELDQLVPGFKDYLYMINEIIQKRDVEKKLNSGKWGIAIKNIASELSRQIKELFDTEGLLQ